MTANQTPVGETDLRQQLEAALAESLAENVESGDIVPLSYGRYLAPRVSGAIWPLIESALAAVRQETARQIAEMIEAKRWSLVSNFDTVTSARNMLLDDCAALARETATTDACEHYPKCADGACSYRMVARETGGGIDGD